MTKYDWSNVPKEVNWIATDEDRFKIYFTSEPIRMPLWWGKQDDYYKCNAPENNEFKGNWQDSLEERPTETVVKSLGEVA